MVLWEYLYTLVCNEWYINITVAAECSESNGNITKYLELLLATTRPTVLVKYSPLSIIKFVSATPVKHIGLKLRPPFPQAWETRSLHLCKLYNFSEYSSSKFWHHMNRHLDPLWRDSVAFLFFLAGFTTSTSVTGSLLPKTIRRSQFFYMWFGKRRAKCPILCYYATTKIHKNEYRWVLTLNE